jgi:hypothetical protein
MIWIGPVPADHCVIQTYGQRLCYYPAPLSTEFWGHGGQGGCRRLTADQVREICPFPENQAYFDTSVPDRKLRFL